MNNLKIYYLAHKQFNTDNIDKQYSEIIYRDNIHNELEDLKMFYSELYMIYDLYKHSDKLPNYVGICHYRRFFDCDTNTLINDLKDNDCIVLSKTTFGNQTIYEQYSRSCNEEDIKIIGAIIKKYYPEYLQDYCDIFNGTEISLCNMIVCKKDTFIDYYRIMFDLLDKFLKYHGWKTDEDVRKYVENNKEKYPNLSLNNIDPYFKTIEYQMRIAGHISERFMNVYIKHHNLKCKEYPLKLVD